MVRNVAQNKIDTYKYMRIKVVYHYLGLLLVILGLFMLLPLGWSLFYRDPVRLLFQAQLESQEALDYYSCDYYRHGHANRGLAYADQAVHEACRTADRSNPQTGTEQ